MSINASDRTRIFISYSHKDTKHLERLRTHLAFYELRGLLDTWDDTKLAPGSLWHEEIKKAIKQTKVAILLVSADFLASKFIAENELLPLLVAAETEGTIIIPVILSACAFQASELAQFQAVNKPSDPIEGMRKSDREKIWNDVTEFISKQVNKVPQELKAAKINNSEFANETERAQQIVLGRSKGWEYLLTAELLRTKLLPIQQRLINLKEGFIYKGAQSLQTETFIIWAHEKTNDLTNLIRLANNVAKAISASWGEPGVPGDPLVIKRAVEKLIFICDEMVNWEIDVHFTLAPSLFLPLKPMMEGWTYQFIAEIERVPDKLEAPFAMPDLPREYTITLAFDAPSGMTAFLVELKRLCDNPQVLTQLR
jgi:hypothetical protein